MIIPPDSEKDATLFSPTSSTPSLISPPSESDIDTPSRVVIRNTAFGYPFGSSQDDLGVGYTHNGDPLPPYPRNDMFVNPEMRERTRRTVTRPHILIPAPSSPSSDELTPRASTSRPYSSTIGSTSKLWERHPPKPSRFQQWWKKWRKWVYIIGAILLAGMGIMVGLFVGINTGPKETPDPNKPWKDVTGDGKRQSNWISTGESLNLTYVSSRDGPTPVDGNITSCPAFRPLNASSPINMLSRPFPAVTSSIARFEIVLDKNLSTSPLQVLPEFTFIARGLGSSGTVEIVGADAPEEVRALGKEGVMVIDVVALYSGPQDLDSIVRVCQLSRGTAGIGLGIFTPVETDGKVSNAYILNPTSLPSFHAVIYLPPSATIHPSQAVSIPKIDYHLDRMAVRFGNLQNIVEFGDVHINSIRGGVNAVYLAAESVDIRTGENTVRGRFNISKSIAINQTEGNILTELILHHPNATIPPDLNNTLPHTIQTTFMTAEGVLAAAYLDHPPSVQLSSLFVNGQGDTLVSLNPNFVGSYVIKDIWGQVRVANPAPIWDSDPWQQGRSRAVSFGMIDVQPNSVYSANGLNTTVLEDSLVALSGVAYWKDNVTLTPEQVLESPGSEVLIANAWGDVNLAVDGIALNQPTVGGRMGP